MNAISKACHRLEQGDGSLSLLNLTAQGLGSSGIKKLAKSCCSCQLRHHNSTLRSPLVAVWLESNEIYSGGAEALRQIIEISPSLKYLYMSHNCMYDSGISQLCPTALCQLQVFHVGNNQIGPSGARAISKSLQDPNCTVNTLILDQNCLRDNGAISIAEGLKQNTTLKYLSLQYNDIGKEGLIAFRDALKYENKTLQHLIIEEDHYGEDCTRLHLEQLHKSPRATNQKDEHCCCETCQLRDEVEYYLALNRAGRHSFTDNHISERLWPRMMARTSKRDPSVLFTMLAYRPDIINST